ncbi:cation diffusion facilitator family transporter [Desulfogranum japonicum]|uniref:cation diffusion facilitator family transporter n=1 Tax=Desulfogranum japonicum TaxID=231447 RepID=UPI0003F70A73|nr:cation diffusion facilitator family transporter [Desulfogranum japonicum]
MNDQKTKKLQKGQKVAFLSVLVSLALAVLKGTVGFLFNSQILIADAIHSCADLMTHAASGFGLWIASQGKTDRFPYGLYRAETFACLIVGLLITVASIDLFKDGLNKLHLAQQTRAFPFFPIAASAISSVAALVVATMESKVGHAIGSKSLIASAKEAYLDIFTSLAVLAGIILAYFQIPYVEGGIILFIAVLLLKIGLENVWIALLILMDANMEPGLCNEITQTICQVSGVVSVDEVKIRQSGPFKMVECIITAEPEATLSEAHNVADRVEEIIAGNFEHIESTLIHVEPKKKDKLLAMIPVAQCSGLNSTVHQHFARAPYHLLVSLEYSKSEVVDCHKNNHLHSREHIGLKTSRLAAESGADLVLTASIGEISFHFIHSHMIEVYTAHAGSTVADTLDKYRDGALTRLNSPAHRFEDSLIHQNNH